MMTKKITTMGSGLASKDSGPLAPLLAWANAFEITTSLSEG
jgi:hypothetical protein